jgi:hypothetical protein
MGSQLTLDTSGGISSSYCAPRPLTHQPATFTTNDAAIMAILVRNQFMPGTFNNYLIAGNICNAFVLGELGSTDDFFLIGAEPPDESNYPLLTGNILDSEGRLLFRLVRNNLFVNPGHCSRILSDHIGYEIHDSAGNLILRVRTAFERLPAGLEEQFVTTISATFYNRHGEVVFRANSGEADERIEASVKSAFGYSGAFGLVSRYDDAELGIARVALETGGAVHELVSGQIRNRDLVLDGKVLSNAHLDGCRIRVHSGDFLIGANTHIENCQFEFAGSAGNLHWLFQQLHNQRWPDTTESV